MKRIAVPARPDWEDTARRLGFAHHERYWTDDACYLFQRSAIETLLRPAVDELWHMALEVVERASRDDEVLATIGVPAAAWDGVRQSWRRGDPSLVTRFDLAFDGAAPPKLHECNGDTPGALYEAAVFQWLWFEDQMAHGHLPQGGDQFNRLHDALVEAFGRMPQATPIHFAASARNAEDRVWALYLADCARQARREAAALDIEAIGIDGAGGLTDLEDRPIRCLVKAYRWQLLLQEPFAGALGGPAAPAAIEPLWKLVLASKGALVWLWRMFPGHPNLLPCWFEGEAAAAPAACAVKPLFSIKGHNVLLRDPALPGGRAETAGPYGAEGRIVQALHYLPRFDRSGVPVWATVGAWIVGGRPEGIGVLEAPAPIIQDHASRFVPHAVVN